MLKKSHDKSHFYYFILILYRSSSIFICNYFQPSVLLPEPLWTSIFSPIGAGWRFPLTYAILFLSFLTPNFRLCINTSAVFFVITLLPKTLFHSAMLSHSIVGVHIMCLLVFIGFGEFNNYSLRYRDNGRYLLWMWNEFHVLYKLL